MGKEKGKARKEGFKWEHYIQ